MDSVIGYDSEIDIYTFQSNLQKIHRALPKGLLPDLLKNNYLDGPALSLVKNVDEISEIWRRLKLSYGDPKLMLNKKLADLSNSGHLWRIKDLEKLIEGISKIINSMKDMIKLAGEHHIEQSLYHGDGLERIYNLLGDSRLTRCFSELWIHLITFLEKEVKVQQQKLLHGCNSDGRKIAFLDRNNQGLTPKLVYSSHHITPGNHHPILLMMQKFKQNALYVVKLIILQLMGHEDRSLFSISHAVSLWK